MLELCNKVIESSKLVEGKIANGYSYNNGKQEPNMVDGKYIEDPSVAEELLPVQEGFFFGSTSYDEYYYQDIVNTKEIMEKALKIADNCEFYYNSSW